MRKKSAWWKGGVIYQIYPRSFQDSNGDGIGDIPGITGRLDYLQDLGVDGIWLSPINPSPMYDFGYDISDYCGIDPVFGTLADFDRLVAEADRRGIRIILDLVLNHTSHLHPWFQAARSARDNPKRDWYIWHPGKNGKPPNNWLGAFGGRAWERDEGTGEFYLHTFLKEQPDVNWRNPELRSAMFEVIRFWLDRGVKGYRFDVINWFLKDDRLRSNPFTFGLPPRPYDLQQHIYDRNRPENHEIVRQIRSIVNEYPDCMTVGEVYSKAPGDPELSASYLGADGDELHLSFDFSLIYRKWDARAFFRCISQWTTQVPRNAWPCWVLSNHDQPRSRSRFGKDSLAKARVAAVMLLTLRGTAFVYYGEEIGMKDGKIDRKQLHDPLGIKYWPLHPGRDPERTPMQWSGTEKHAGFSGETPWLPLGRDWRERNVADNQKDPDSLLHLYRSLIRLRKEKTALQHGTWHPLADGEKQVIAYQRITAEEKITVALNFSGRRNSLLLPDDDPRKLLLSTGNRNEPLMTGGQLTLDGYEAVVMET
jgi:alpha-glucosidase